MNEKTIADLLNTMHQDIVGDTTILTDTGKIVEILEVLIRKIEVLQGHTHTIN